MVGGEGFSTAASLIRSRVPPDFDAARTEEEIGGSDDDRSIGGGRRNPSKDISLTDPQAAWVARKSTDPFFAYDANYLIDNKAGIIVDAEANVPTVSRRSPSPRP
jgi:hypothetical protein